MQRIRICAVAVLLLVSVFQGPRLFAQDDFDYSVLGEGSITIQTSTFEKGSVISVETNLEDVAAIVVEDDTAHRELVRVGTRRVQRDFRAKRGLDPEANVVVEADSIRGRFEQKIAYDLSATRALRITITLTSGVEVPSVFTTRDSMANRKITKTFNNKACYTITLTCGNGCYRSRVCCTIESCSDCIDCAITCARCNIGGGGGGCATSPTPAEQALVAIPLDGGDAPDLTPSSFGLHRTERSNASLSFLMDEWAVISYSSRAGEAGPHVEVLKSSSPEFGAAKSRDLDRGARGEAKRSLAGRNPSQGTVLIVESPVHPLNSRFATLPKLRFSDLNTPVGTEPLELVVRADFAADKSSPDGLQVLHADGVVPADLVELLRERLEVERDSGTRHRVIVFAKVKVDGTRLDASSLAMVMPKCCCGSFHCV
jgi:hypothetical protein